VTAALTGSDPLAPRPLELWQRDGDRLRFLARTASEANGRFDFGQWPMPHRATGWIVVPASGDPRTPSPTRFARRLPAPEVHLEPLPDGALLAHFFPALYEGTLELLDEHGNLVERITVAPSRTPGGTRASRLTAAVRPGAGVEIVQVLDDGRRSAPRHVVGPARAAHATSAPHH
jgi:hypothetical protein